MTAENGPLSVILGTHLDGGDELPPVEIHASAGEYWRCDRCCRMPAACRRRERHSIGASSTSIRAERSSARRLRVVFLRSCRLIGRLKFAALSATRSGLRQIQLPGDAKTVVQPRKGAAESVRIKRHEHHSAFAERSGYAPQFFVRRAFDKQRERRCEVESMLDRAVEAHDDLLADPKRSLLQCPFRTRFARAVVIASITSLPENSET